VHDADPHDDPVPSHRAVLDAIARQAPDEAEKAMRNLLDKATRDFARVRGDERTGDGA
jgi:GntR family transcriptional regulator, galactonate operon transcriptional repressor